MSKDIRNTSGEIVPNRILDVKGLICPMPLLRAKKEIDKIDSGEILEIRGTDPGSRKDFPGWAGRAGHEYLGEKEESGFIRFFIRKK